MKAKIAKLKELLFENSQYLNKTERFQYLPLNIAEVKAFENRHKIVLPAGYRDFLLHIGNGGPGPGQGILPLDIGKTYTNLPSPWVDPIVFNKQFQYDKKEELDVFNNRIEQILTDKKSDTALVYNAADNGVLCIADSGGGTYFILVVNGPNKGQIWVNALVSDGGFVQQADSFAEWYEKWLNEKIQLLKNENLAIKNRYSNSTTNIFTPHNLDELHAFIESFKQLKNKKPVKGFFEWMLNEKENQPSDILQACIQYTLHYLYLDYDLALKLIKKITQKSHQQISSTLLCLEGKALVGLERYSQAIDCFEKALEYENHEWELDDEYIKLLNYCYLKLDLSERALGTMVSEGEIYDFDTTLYLLNEYYHTHRDYEISVKWGQLLLNWELLLEDDESEEYLPDIYLILIYSYAWLKNDKQVHRFIDKLIKIQKTKELIPYEIMAEELICAKCYSIALRCLESYASYARSKENLQVLFNLKGRCHLGLNSHKEAISCFQKSFDVHHWIVPYKNLVKSYFLVGYHDLAKQVFDKIISFDPYQNVENIGR
nr:SMI1/KNR4 family protein [uncultured Allomuricauda sp.]